jgi:hydroxyacylglutathione hydrolase
MSEFLLSGSSGALRYQILPSGCISCNCAVLWHDETRDAVVIDPTDDARKVIAFAAEQGLKVRQILLTHAHFDHAADTERAMTAFACPAFVHESDARLYLDAPLYAPMFGLKVSPRTMELGRVVHGQSVNVVADATVQVLHVPGHSAGSVAYYVSQAGWCFVGDTLFCRGVGRTDLPGGSSQQLTMSIRTHLYALPDETIAFPGHGPTTTIGAEKRANPFVRAA